YVDANGVLPPSASVRVAPTFGWHGWGVHTKLLAYVDNGAKYDSFNFDFQPSQAANTTAIERLGTVFLCPSDVNAYVRRASRGYDNVNYGFNRGDWYVWGGVNATELPVSPFYPNSAVRMAQVNDGLSKTLFAAEVKARLWYLRHCTNFSGWTPATQPGPNADPLSVAAYMGCTGGAVESKDTLHGEWHNGADHHSGFTTAWTPNRKTAGKLVNPTVDDGASPYPPGTVLEDVDVTGAREQTGGPTWSAITARSYHAGGVNVLMGDGSVTFVGDSIDGATWRALGTIAGGEAASL
ncbi:MAG: DUF1559 domain-containing protein, partial [Planctomycetia bacterium]